MTIPQLPAVIEPAYLTAALRKAGALDRGAVREVKVLHEHPAIVSHVIRLGLRYVGESAGAPQSLIFKTAQAAFAKTLSNAGRQEVAFYTRLATKMPPGLVPRCFDGSFDEESFTWHLLLEDLTDSHEIAAQWPLPPSREQAMAIVTTLARMHAAWWDHASLGGTIGTWMSIDDSAKLMETFAGHYDRFADLLGDRLSEERRVLYRRLIEQSGRLFQRYHSRRHVTIAHGDAHIWNFLLPRSGVTDTVRIFDFDQWRINVPTGDLAYMMATQWYPERRQALERSLLNLYHETLIAHGVSGYTRGALDQDYRSSVLWHITKPVWQWSVNIPTGDLVEQSGAGDDGGRGFGLRGDSGVTRATNSSSSWRKPGPIITGRSDSARLITTSPRQTRSCGYGSWIGAPLSTTLRVVESCACPGRRG